MKIKKSSLYNSKIIYCGSGFVGYKILKILLNNTFFVVKLVVLKKSGKTNQNIINLCHENNIPLLLTNNVNNEIIQLTKLKVNLLLTCSFGQFLKRELLEKFLVVNIHFSLLPKYRGGAPVERAIINGEKLTGVSIMKTVLKMDKGPVYFRDKIEIKSSDNVLNVYEKLFSICKKNLNVWINEIIKDKIQAKEQSEKGVSYAYEIKNNEEAIDLNNDLEQINNWLRGMLPLRSMYFIYDNKRYKIWNWEVLFKKNQIIKEPIINDFNNQKLVIQCHGGNLIIKSIQPENKKIMNMQDFYNGWKNKLLINSKIT